MSSVAETATVIHGYTMADINRLARAAVSRHQRSQTLDYDDRLSAAWHAIVVTLYTRENPPQGGELFIAALDALSHEYAQRRHHHGLTPTGQAPKFGRYWLPIRSGWSDGFSDHLCEKLALRDALSVLTAEQYEAIATLAAYDNDFAAAAAAVGMKYHGFYYRVLTARKKIKAVWFEGETPIQRGNPTDTCRAGHARREFGERKADGTWSCRRCIRNGERRRAARRRQELGALAAG